MKYVCSVCGYIYDESVEGILFNELPDNWRCPVCGAPKSEFFPLYEDTKEANNKEIISDSMSMTKLTPGELSALCSNLEKGCEKQYKDKEARLFKRLADYFESVTPASKTADIMSLATQLQRNIDIDYPEINKTNQKANDRGAMRACTWGEKVTRMLNSLVKKYLIEGENMLKDTEIWICTICGYIYIGNEPPQICPVCKVPSWKFNKVGGGNIA